MEGVERDAAHLGLALLDMSAQQHFCLVDLVLEHCSKNPRVFLVGGVKTLIELTHRLSVAQSLRRGQQPHLPKGDKRGLGQPLTARPTRAFCPPES